MSLIGSCSTDVLVHLHCGGFDRGMKCSRSTWYSLPRTRTDKLPHCKTIGEDGDIRGMKQEAVWSPSQRFVSKLPARVIWGH